MISYSELAKNDIGIIIYNIKFILDEEDQDLRESGLELIKTFLLYIS